MVEPNPMVGAVIVRDGRVLGEGWHESYGGPHAEINAIGRAREGCVSIEGATIYVTLEPCSHTGKTPPCTRALLRERFVRCVVAMEDPDENVAGRGIAMLREGGIAVDVGVRGAVARDFLAPYIKTRKQLTPWILLKWAQTRDGYLARPDTRWVSCPASLSAVQELRKCCDGILVGARTARKDNPALTNRTGHGRTPTRIVLDSRLQTPLESRLVTNIAEAPTLLACAEHALDARAHHAAALHDAGVELLPLPSGPTGLDLRALLAELGRRRMTRLLVEGGPTVLQSFLSQGLADELWRFVSPDLAAPQPSHAPAPVVAPDRPSPADLPAGPEHTGRAVSPQLSKLPRLTYDPATDGRFVLRSAEPTGRDTLEIYRRAE